MQVIGRTHHLLVSAWGKRWREVNLVMSKVFTAYIDDSGTDPAQAVAIATALIVPAKQIIALEKEWDALKKKWGFGCFHMAEFSAKNPKYESKFGSWNSDEHAQVFTKVRQIAKKYGVMTISFAVYKKDYDEVVPDELKKYAGRFHYSWAVRMFIARIHKWREQHSPTAFGVCVRLDREERSAQDGNRRCDGTGGIFKRWNRRISRITHLGDDCQVPGLQCSDMLAWISYQSALMVYVQKKLYPDARIGWEDLYRHGDGEWRYTLAITRGKLRRWAEDEQNQKSAFASFQRWQAHVAAQKEIHAKPGVRKIRCRRAEGVFGAAR